LYYQSWLPEIEPGAAIILVHGIVEHSGRYENTASYLISKGYAVYALDHRYHGRSEGKHGCLDHYSYFMDDLRTFHDLVKKLQPGKKTFLLGHSMGAGIALAYGINNQNDLSGLLISGNSLYIEPHVPSLLVTMMLLISALAPGLGIYKINSSLLCHDKNIVQALDNDPLSFRGKMTARLTVEFAHAMDQLVSQITKIKIPVLIMHGSDDRVCSPKGAMQAYKNIRSSDKTLKLYPGSYHEILNEPGKARVLEDIGNWLDERVS
jgi:acylglycerol lipase